MLDHRFLLFTGKGGVGKTTVVASMALQAARLGYRPLVVELGHRASMRSVFRASEIGYEPSDVGHGVYAMSVDIDLAVIDYMADHIPSRRIAKAVVQNKVLERLFKAMPAVGEIATVNALRRQLRAQAADGTPKWGPIFVDLDATGHAMMFLELRNVVGGLMGAGPMRQLIDEVAEIFADPAQTLLNLVTLPSELPVTETAELYDRVAESGAVTFGRLYVNRVPATDMPAGCEADIDRILALAREAGDTELVADATYARRAVTDRTRAEALIERLRARVPVEIVELPQRSAARLEIADLMHMGALALSLEDA